MRYSCQRTEALYSTLLQQYFKDFASSTRTIDSGLCVRRVLAVSNVEGVAMRH
jgi:hypothetical protein